MLKIEKVELSPNPVSVNGKVKISVTIVTHEYLNKIIHTRNWQHIHINS